MKKFFMTILATCTLYAYNGGVSIGGSEMDIVKGSGKIVKKRFNLKAFTKVKVDASIELVIKKASTSAYSITADDNLIRLIGVENRGKTVIIRSKKSYQTNNSIKVVLYTKALNALIVDGVADIQLKGLSEDSLMINLDGTVDLSATSGNIGHLTITADGAYDVDLRSLNVKNATVKMKGSGDANIYVSQKLDAKVSDNASLLYSGTAVVVKKISDNGEIDKN